MPLKRDVKSKNKKNQLMVKKKVIEDLVLKLHNNELANKPKYQWAEHYGVTRMTFDKYVREAIGKVPLRELNEIKVDTRLVFDQMNQRMKKLWNKAIDYDDPKAELFVMREYRQTLADMTKFLEEYGFKEKIAETLNVNADITHKQVIVNVNLLEGANAKG